MGCCRPSGIPEGPRVKLLYALRTKRYPPKSGNINTMKTFLTSLGLARYCKAFEEGEVDMRAIDVMEESDYANLGVAKVCAISNLLSYVSVHRALFLRRIYRIRRTNAARVNV